MTNRLEWLKKNKLEDRSYSLKELSKISKVPMKILTQIRDRAYGAYKTQPDSVRMLGTFKKGVKAPMSMKLSKNAWSFGRIYSYLNGSVKHDLDLPSAKSFQK